MADCRNDLRESASDPDPGGPDIEVTRPLEVASLLDALPQSAYVVDRTLRVVAWNCGREEGAQGIPRERAVGRQLCDVVAVDGFERAVAEINQVLRTGCTHSSKNLVREGGRVFRSHRLPVRQGGTITHVLSLFEDVTAEQDADRLRQALYGIAEVTQSSQDMPTFYRSIHEILRDLVQARNLSVVLREPNGDALAFAYYEDDSGAAPPPINARDALTGTVLRTGEPLAVQAATVTKDRPRCWLGVPLRGAGATFGVLAMFGYEPGLTFTDRERDLLTFVGRHIATAILRKRDALALAQERDLLRRIIDNLPDQIYAKNRRHEFILANAAVARKILGNDEPEPLIGKTDHDFFPMADAERYRTIETEVMTSGHDVIDLEEVAFYQGRKHWNLTTKVVLRDHDQKVSGIVGINRDITIRRDAEEQRAQLEDRLHRAQKMEVVGRLAGGIAHDFNNILGVVMLHAEAMQRALPLDHPQRRKLDQVLSTTERGARLTRQLLAFSRRQVLQPRILDLTLAVRDMEQMLERILGEDVELSIIAPDNGCLIKADPAQIEQVVMNLTVNARDAMPRGGRLTIETASADRSILLTVRDTGEGMSAETREHIFEPFFTTKPEGKGTGLGLATVYGIVQQSGGSIDVESERGVGTQFQIRLPRVDAQLPAPAAQSTEDHLPQGGRETVLVVEDEPRLLAVVRETLEPAGYVVLSAAGPSEALSIAAQHAGAIHLLLTDLVMPRMDGITLARTLRRARAAMSVLYMSGHAAEALAAEGVSAEEVELLRKPFRGIELLRSVRVSLDRPRPR